MMEHRGMSDTDRDRSRRRSNTLAVTALGMALAAAFAFGQDTSTPDKDKTRSGKSAGFVLSEDVTAKDVGLPIYPGAQQRKDTTGDSSGFEMGLWGGSSGFKLVVLKLESDGSPEKIAAFYRKALARYGQVLDCSQAATKPEKAESHHANQIECEDDRPATGGFALKAGTKQNQHLVAVEPSGKHTNISLVYLWTPKSENNED
ncbi:MAG TPA: hypothetical protein VIX19_19680 [Terriglobales bacterium]